MNKPDIAKLVAAALEAEFGSYRNAELQHITAVNDGQHGESLAVCLLLTKKGESHKAFEAERYDWWRSLIFGVPTLVNGRMTLVESNDRRVTLDEAAGLLLGFSQTMTMTMAAKFVDAHVPKTRALSRQASDGLETVFTERHGLIEDALQKKDLFADRDGRIKSFDLIAWAKEKGCVADEVLAAWDGLKSEAGEVEQVTAPATPEAVEPEPQTAQATKGNTPRVERHTTKGKRSDTLTPVIEHAQSLCKSLKQDEWDTAEVWGKLHTLTAQNYTVLLHLEGDAVVYTDGDNTKKLTKKMLGDRLRGMRKRLANAA